VELTVAPLPPDICAFVVTDRHWLAENVLCLLSNAAKYSDGGPIRVEVSLRCEPNTLSPLAALSNAAKSSGLTLSSAACEPPSHSSIALRATAGRLVRVSVIDSGIGIPSESRQHLFQPFGQTQRRAGGTGLGLYSLRRRMEALHGACGVSRRADGQRGSVFWFEFPYRPDESAAAMTSTRLPSSHSLGTVDATTAVAALPAPVADGKACVDCIDASTASWAVRRTRCQDADCESGGLRILIGIVPVTRISLHVQTEGLQRLQNAQIYILVVSQLRTRSLFSAWRRKFCASAGTRSRRRPMAARVWIDLRPCARRMTTLTLCSATFKCLYVFPRVLKSKFDCAYTE
jgi:hypothetical protein